MKCPKHDIEYRIRRLGNDETVNVCSECDRENREKIAAYYRGAQPSTPTKEEGEAKP